MTWQGTRKVLIYHFSHMLTRITLIKDLIDKYTYKL